MTTVSQPKQDKKTPTRDALLDAAEVLFTKHGYSAVSTRDIAETAGTNLGAIQYHFGSKAHLFAETVRRLMSFHWTVEPFVSLAASVPQTKEEGARQLYLFVYRFLDEMFHPHGPQACRLMHREILGEPAQDPEMLEALVSSVSEEFAQPLDTHLQSLLRVIQPEATADELAFYVQSIIGQVLFFFTNRPFIERVRNVDCSARASFDQIVQNIMRFSLRGLGCQDHFIAKVLADPTLEALATSAAPKAEIATHTINVSTPTGR